METVRKFEERSVALGHQSLVKDAVKYAEELELTLNLTHPQPLLDTDMGEVPAKKIKAHLKKSQEEQLEEMVRDQKWQGKLLRARWEAIEARFKLFDCIWILQIERQFIP